jgi:spermidine synthase
MTDVREKPQFQPFKVESTMVFVEYILFLLFFVSGFCGLVYQVVWLRSAFSAFGTITPVMSLVVSVFMLGLGTGSWAGGRWIEALEKRTRFSPLWFYGMTELVIGIGAFSVPKLFQWGENYLLSSGAMDSGRYLFLSAVIIVFSLLPWCICMGATYPLMMAYVKKLGRIHKSSFSYLYLGNVLGAAAGVTLTGIVLIETFGFRATWSFAAALNVLIACTSFALAFRDQSNSRNMEPVASRMSQDEVNPADDSGKLVYIILFTTGFCSMAMEIVWTRAFTPITTTTIYAFVLLLAVYLIATFEGSRLYRKHLRAGKTKPIRELLAFLAVTAFLPLIVNDPRLHPSVLHIVFSLMPLCGVLGYITPSLIDRYSAGDPRTAGRLYAVNIAGAILGPLFAGYLLLPLAGAKWALILLALPFTLLFCAQFKKFAPANAARVGWTIALVMTYTLSFMSVTYEDKRLYEGGIVYRDHVATVIAAGHAMDKHLFVNGVTMTSLTPITKIMAHLPLSSLPDPRSILIICFGMGTTYRSALQWGVDVTAVELVPSVKKTFGYFFQDAPEVLKNPRGKIIIDDGRRYLSRTAGRFDVIAIDPPPPVETSGSSFLYSEQFYELAKEHLQQGGILQQWFPNGEDKILHAVVGALLRSFRYVRVYHSVESYGYHLLASEKPIHVPSVDVMLKRMPKGAQLDLMEWFPERDIRSVLSDVLGNEVSLRQVSDSERRLSITDDRPYNEYYLLRRASAISGGIFKKLR